jgi:hypothetical protein
MKSVFLTYILLGFTSLMAQYNIIVDASLQMATLFQDNKVVQGFAEIPIATGMLGHETPEGTWSVLSAKVSDRSNKFGVNMPFCFRTDATGGGICMHEGPVYPGAASHGCIRVHHDLAENLFDTVGDNWKSMKIVVVGSIKDYIRKRLDGLVSFDENGRPVRFIRDSSGRLPDEFLKALHDGRVTLFCENKSGMISFDQSQWFISLEFWPDKRSKGVTLAELHSRFGQKVNLTDDQIKELHRRVERY